MTLTARARLRSLAYVPLFTGIVAVAFAVAAVGYVARRLAPGLAIAASCGLVAHWLLPYGVP